MTLTTVVYVDVHRIPWLWQASIATSTQDRFDKSWSLFFFYSLIGFLCKSVVTHAHEHVSMELVL